MRKKFDWLLFSLIISVGSISLLVLYSLNKSLALNQFIYWIIGLIAFFIASKVNIANWQRFTFLMYAGTLLGLILLFFISDPVRGSVRWIDFGFFRLQPSEIAKISSIFSLAVFYKERSAKKIKNFLLSLLIIAPFMTLVIKQPDIGNTLSLGAIWLGITLTAGVRPKVLTTFFAMFLILGFIAYEFLAPYQRERIISFINPNIDPLGIGYNVIQAKVAVGSGQLFGRGLGQGTQSQLNFLPEAESDFIFAAISEQLGFLGAGLLLVLYTLMIKRTLKALTTENRFAKLLTVGIVSLIVFQFAINVGMNMGVFPITGITFPLISYGGSSLISTLILLGIIFRINSTKTQGS